VGKNHLPCQKLPEFDIRKMLKVRWGEMRGMGSMGRKSLKMSKNNH